MFNNLIHFVNLFNNLKTLKFSYLNLFFYHENNIFSLQIFFLWIIVQKTKHDDLKNVSRIFPFRIYYKNICSFEC